MCKYRTNATVKATNIQMNIKKIITQFTQSKNIKFKQYKLINIYYK